MTGVFRFVPMSEQITLSLNELRALLRKAFEGVFGHERDWNAMADNVLWLESHGYDGLATFFAAYPKMIADKKASLSITPSGEIIINSHGTSLLEYVHLVGDILLLEVRGREKLSALIQTTEKSNVLNVLHPVFANIGYIFDSSTDAEGIKVTVTSGECKLVNQESYYLNALEHGIALEKTDYERLCRYADKVLVPATEQSRRGAGE